MRQKAGARGEAVKPVVLLPNADGPLAHVHVDHQFGTGLQSHHREGAGVGKQVQHPKVRAARHLLHVIADPAPALGHVQKQPVVLPLQHMHAKPCTLLRDHMRIRHLPRHQPGLGAAIEAALVDPVQRLLRSQLLPACGQSSADGGQFVVAGGLEAGQHQNRRKSIQRPVLAARMQTTPAMENALRIGRQIHRCDGVQ